MSSSMTNVKSFADDKKSIDDKISMLERYILAEDKEGFFNSLVFNSDTYLYMKLNDMLNKQEDISELLTGGLSNYFEDVENSLKLEILFKDLANRIPKEADPAKRKVMIDRFNQEFLNLGFNFKKPDEIKKSEGITTANQVVYNSAISPEDSKRWTLEKSFDRYFSTPTNQTPNLGVFKPNTYLFFNLEKLAEKNPDHFLTVLKSLPHYYNIPDFEKLLEVFLKKRIEKHASFQFPLLLFSKMGLGQMEALLLRVPSLLKDYNFVSVLFLKKFENHETQAKTPAERIALLKTMLKWCDPLPNDLNGLAHDIVVEAINVGLTNKIYDEELYNLLINKPPYVHHFYSEALKEKVKNWKYVQGNWNSVHNFKKSLWQSEEDIIGLYLERYFETKPYEDFLPFFQGNWLKRKFYTYKLQKGEKFNNITDTFTEIELNTLRDKKELVVLPETSMQFKGDDQVKVTLKFKNIQNLQVNIYEINGFNYYKKRNSKIDAKINLAGVIPTWTFKTEFKHPPIVLFQESFVFDQITKAKRGVFIVEFVGDGLSTRALIKKGNLNLVRDSGNEGHNFYILDENNQICKGPEAKLHLQNKVYAADATGCIFVPYMNENISSNVIISFENYSEICNINLTRTDLVFDASLIFNEETIESGRNASFIIQPKLFAYNRLVSVGLLKDVKVIITSKNLQDVRHSKVVEDVKFQENEDFVVDYLIPSKTTEITFDIKGVVFDKVTNKEVNLSNQRKITINRRDNNDVYYDLFLKQEAGAYKIRLVGKNGEVYPGYQIQVTLSSNYLTNNESYTLETGKDGEVNLGSLNGIWSVSANLKTTPSQYKSINKSWIIDSLERFKNFPEDFDIVEGEDLCLPALGETLTPEDYSLVRTDQVYDNVYEDKFKNIQKEGELLYLSGLKEGYYVFYFNKLRDSKKITLRVHKGQRWEVSNNYLLKEKQMIKMMNQSNYLTYTQLRHTETELELKVLSNEIDTVKVHVMGYNHFPDYVRDIVQSLKGNCLTEKSEVTNFASNFNEFYSEKELSDELKYVLERKNRPTFMGNTLEKPSGLLKRHFKQKTRADREVLGAEKDYGKSLLSKTDDMVTRSLTYTRYDRKGPVSSFNLELMNSFLQERGQVVTNAGVDPEGFITIDISKFKHLSTALVIIEDRHNCLCEIVNLGTRQPVLRDLRLEQSREANKVYLHDRTVHKLALGQKLNIKDLNNTEMTVVDNQGYLLEILKLVSGRRDLDEWDFLKRWETMESEEKLKKYDKYMSHELHVYTYFKDKEFFEMVVKAHILNKNEKSFIDYFLLGDKTAMLVYLDKVRVHKLNIIEQALLIHAFKASHPKECNQIFELLKMFKDKSVEDLKSYNALFDTVLKSEQTKEKDEKADKDAAHTIGTNFTASASRVSGMGRGGANPNGTYGKVTSLSNVQFDKGEGDYSIKENRGGTQSFRTMGVTEEFIERQYFFSDANNLEVTSFWLDFIEHNLNRPTEPFLSQNFISSARSNVEMLAILSVLDLTSEKVDNEVLNDQTGFNLTVKQNSVVFCKEIKERNNDKMDLDMIISQQFFDIFDRTERAKDGSNKLKKVTEFVTGTIYASRIAITNLSETQHDITLVSEIPQGSIPVKSQDYLKSTVMSIEPLSTKINEFFFYLPSEGTFTCYPAAITKDGCLIASSNVDRHIKVYKELPKKELKTMKDILSGGKTEDILNFMRTQNILDPNVFKFEDIYWLLPDKPFYESVIEILENRFVFDQTTFSFSVLHGDIPRMRIYLAKHFQDKRITIRELDIYCIKNDLFNIDDFKFREYFPLINPRVHDIGEYKHNILNRDFMNTYITFLKYLLDKGKLGSKDWFYLAIYFLLQDRVDDVLTIFPKIVKTDLVGNQLFIQYDYLAAYLDLYMDYPAFKKAREICIQYLTYPIYTWRNKFIDLANQIAEFDGQVEISKIITEENAGKDKKKDAQKQIHFEASVTDNKLKVQSRNVVAYTVNLYEVDLEVMFSQDPFLERDSDSFSFIKPNHTLQQTLPESDDLTVTLLDIPAEFAKKNLLIQLICKDQVKSVTYFPSTLQTFVIENHGQIKVDSPDGKPLSKVYVKCFSKANNGTVSFYKDGYTDMRGTFDYAALNLESQKNITMFALLISSKENGALIQKVVPPSDMQKAEGEAMKLKAETWQKKQMEQAYDDDMEMVMENATEEKSESKRTHFKESFAMKKNKYWK